MPWKATNGMESPVLLELQFHKIGAGHKLSGGVGTGHMDLMSTMCRVSLILVLNHSLLKRE
jgi:hypothetical protein